MFFPVLAESSVLFNVIDSDLIWLIDSLTISNSAIRLMIH